VYKVPWGNYDIITIFPKDMTVYPEKATGAKYIGSWNYYTGNSVQSYHFCKDRWFVWSVHLKVPLKFNAGYGKHGILILGGCSSVIYEIISYPGIKSAIEKLAERFAIGSNEIGIIIVAISTGANVDIIGFNEV